MALMDTVGKVVGKVVKFADDYKVRVDSQGAALLDHQRATRRTLRLFFWQITDTRLTRLLPPKTQQDYFHYGLIPAIIVIGMTTTPRPGLAALLTPV
jgi:hypothetical protein